MDRHGGLWGEIDLHHQAKLEYLIQFGPVEGPYPAALTGDVLHQALRHQTVEGLLDGCGTDAVAGAEITQVDLLAGGQIFLDDVFSDVVISHIYQCVAGDEMRTSVHERFPPVKVADSALTAWAGRCLSPHTKKGG